MQYIYQCFVAIEVTSLHTGKFCNHHKGASQKTENKARYGNYGNHAADPLPAFILSLKEKGAPTKMQAAPLKAG